MNTITDEAGNILSTIPEDIVPTINGYVASEKDIEMLTAQHVGAARVAGSTGETYLKFLVATTQSELNDEHTQLETMEAVSSRFYGAVLRALPVAADAKERNRLSNWARSSKSTLRRWLSTPGNDIMNLLPERVTKASITVPRARGKPVKSAAFERQVGTIVGKLDDLAKRLEDDPKAKKNAIAAIEDLVTHAMSILAEMGVEETSSPQVAVQTGRPYRSKAGLFFPVTSPAGTTLNG